MDETSPGSFLVPWFGTTSVESLVLVTKLFIIIFHLMCYKIDDHSSRAVEGMSCLRPLEHWNRGF
jgi:hypothetical protein